LVCRAVLVGVLELAGWELMRSGSWVV
jgi:hypothetical protein